MPSPILHLEVIFKLSQVLQLPISSDLLLGSISPDAIHMRSNQTWTDKSLTHLYEVADVDFNEAINQAKILIQCESTEFKLGYLIHLYTDYLWREKMYTPFFLTRKDQMERSKLHALYYRDMQRIDSMIFNQAKWLEVGIHRLKTAIPIPCYPLLSKAEVEAWRKKVL